MSSEGKEKRPIEPPNTNHPDDKVRVVVLGILQTAVPVVGGMAVQVAEEIFPSQKDKALGVWANEISARTNENTSSLERHELILVPTRTVTGIVAELIEVLAKDCPDGLHTKYYELDELRKLVPSATRRDLEEAVFDLKNNALLNVDESFGDCLINLTLRFYVEFDHQIMGWNTVEDTKKLCRLMLDQDIGLASELHERSGWDRRRFNPAFGLLLSFLPQTWISDELQQTYPTSQVIVCSEARAVLRRFLLA